jgi:hypothetical protein
MQFSVAIAFSLGGLHDLSTVNPTHRLTILTRLTAHSHMPALLALVYTAGSETSIGSQASPLPLEDGG